MIHQLIFAAPKPGMAERDFQDYWRTVHAVRFASRIPQIRKYAVDDRVPRPTDSGEPTWSGVGEIWLRDDEEQIASLQTPEFIEGARADEPNWAAFWRTLVLDTDAHTVLQGPEPDPNRQETKLFILVKRREGMRLEEFRERALGAHASLATRVPGLRRYVQGHTRDAAYGIGEAPLDAAFQLWFDSPDAEQEAERSTAFEVLVEDLLTFAEPRYLHTMVAEQHWIIGPQPR